MLAILNGINKWNTYLIVRHFKVRIDHDILRVLLVVKEIFKRSTRMRYKDFRLWFCYEFKDIYKKGNTMWCYMHFHQNKITLSNYRVTHQVEKLSNRRGNKERWVIQALNYSLFHKESSTITCLKTNLLALTKVVHFA